jgi:hypothetical protein
MSNVTQKPPQENEDLEKKNGWNSTLYAKFDEEVVIVRYELAKNVMSWK